MIQRSEGSGRERPLRRVGELPPLVKPPPLSPERATEILRSRSHGPLQGPDPGKCAEFQNAQVLSVEPVISSEVWSTYQGAVCKLRSKHRQYGVEVKTVPLVEQLKLHLLDSALNEGYYFHGTDAESARRIQQFGFDERCSKGIYGDGVYFTPDACKALQYSKPTGDGSRILILARVLVGDPFFTESRLSTRHPPPRDPLEPGLLYDSVIARPGPTAGAPGDYQNHTEVVMFNGAQTYPAYIMRVGLRNG
mmetsp:Transcript_65607/g.213636  ORF Transcript_65607/g.213636 Transcript_65607/m.213636 type:complete len:250 (+) Transcript_65607:483-1232(+)